MKTTMARVAIFVSLAAMAAAAQGSNTRKFDASALFQPGMSTMRRARETCAKGPGREFSACFVLRMQAAGASPQAVAFMHAIDNDGFMRDFRETGRVDIAFAVYPFAANENQHCLLVNGTPNLIDVDNYDLLPKKPCRRTRPTRRCLRSSRTSLCFPATGPERILLPKRNLPKVGSAFWFRMFWSMAAMHARVSGRCNWLSISTERATFLVQKLPAFIRSYPRQ